MDIERRIVSAMARTQSMKAALSHGLESHHFLQRKLGDESPEPLPGEVYDWMLEHLRRFKSVPSLELLRLRWPEFRVIDSTDSPGALLEEMMRLINRRLVGGYARKMAELADDPSRLLDAESIVFEHARELVREMPGSNATRYSDALSMLDLYKEKAATGQTPGVSFGMQWLDDITYGIQRHEMMIIEAFLGQRKSSWALKMCADAYFLRDQTPMFFSFEMDADKLVEKWISVAARFKHEAIGRLELGEGDLERWEEVGMRAEDARLDKDIIVFDDERRPTEDYIYSKLVQWEPSFAVVDTIDEVRAPAHCRTSYERGDYVARELKGITRQMKIPLVAVAQANREAALSGASISNIADSITIPRKADIVVGMHATEEQKRSHMCEFTLLKNRSGGGEGMKSTMYFHPGTMELRSWLPSDNVPARGE